MFFKKVGILVCLGKNLAQLLLSRLPFVKLSPELNGLLGMIHMIHMSTPPTPKCFRSKGQSSAKLRHIDEDQRLDFVRSIICQRVSNIWARASMDRSQRLKVWVR